MRLFIGACPDEAARAVLARSLEALRRHAGPRDTAFRWVRPENLHVTLHFLGEVDAAGLTRLHEALAAPIGLPAFDVRTGGYGRFPPRGPVTTLWIGIGLGRDELSAVHRALAGRLAAAGLGVERRPFAAHLTLARARDRDRRRLPEFDLPLDAPEAAAWRVTEATLFESDLAGAAPRYEPRLRVPLETAD